MKFIGLFGGEFKILEDLEASQLEGLQPDFAWIDVDGLDAQTDLFFKQQFSIENTSGFGFPIISSTNSYDKLSLIYYDDLSKRELLVFVLDKYIITLHSGADPICDGNMASLNEMLVSGDFNKGMVLAGLFTMVLERHKEHLKTLNEAMRKIESNLNQGIKDISHVSNFRKQTRATRDVFAETRDQIADIALGVSPIRGMSDRSVFTSLFNKANMLAEASTELEELSESYIDELLPFMWRKLNSVKANSLMLSIVAIFIAASASFYFLFPDGLFGIDRIFLSAGIFLMGIVASLVVRGTMKFSASLG
jgi:hypothetical protein